MGNQMIDQEAATSETSFTDTSGARQIAGFYGPVGQRTFGAFHLPAHGASGGVLICPALHSDFERAYRMDVLLSRALNAHGYAVHRFHYRGHGNSEGVASEVTFETMREDALSAAERLRRIAQVEPVAFVGTRWGALVAASAASEIDGSPLVLWEPTMVAARYFREASRARAVRDAQHGRTPVSWQTLLDDLHREGSIDVLGYSIDRALYDSATGRTLPDLLGGSPRPVLLLRMGGERTLSSADIEIVRGWEGKGFDVETYSVDKEEGWWFVGDAWEAIEARASTAQLLERTTGWMGRWLPSSGVS